MFVKNKKTKNEMIFFMKTNVGKWKQGTRCKIQGARNRKQETENKEQLKN